MVGSEKRGGRNAGNGFRARAVPVAAIRPVPVAFLWNPYIPLGKLTILEGDPGTGKSFLSCAIAAAVSTGRALPGQLPQQPEIVLMLAAEDGLADTIRPRLDSMGADLKKIIVVDAVPEGSSGDAGLPLALTDDGISELEGLIAGHQPDLVVIDPLVAHIPSRVDVYRANEVREILTPLVRLAEQYGCAILLIRHLSKSERPNATYRGAGSIDFTAAARSVLLVGRDPTDREQSVMLHTKCNVAREGPGQVFRVRDGYFEWGGQTDITPEELLGAHGSRPPAERLEEAKNFLRDVLADGPCPSSEVYEEAKSRGISRRTLQRASRDLGVNHRRVGTTGNRGEGHWVSEFPDSDPEIRDTIKTANLPTMEDLATLNRDEGEADPIRQPASAVEQEAVRAQEITGMDLVMPSNVVGHDHVRSRRQTETQSERPPLTVVEKKILPLDCDPATADEIRCVADLLGEDATDKVTATAIVREIQSYPPVDPVKVAISYMRWQQRAQRPHKDRLSGWHNQMAMRAKQNDARFRRPPAPADDVAPHDLELPEQEPLRSMCRECIEQYGAVYYRQYLEPLHFVAWDGRTLHVATSDRYVAEWLTARPEPVLAALGRCTGLQHVTLEVRHVLDDESVGA